VYSIKIPFAVYQGTIGDYVKKRVQDLTNGKQIPNLRGVKLEKDFKLGAAK
jgi:hypothetical protein